MLLGANSFWLVREVLAGAPDARTYSVLPSLFRGLFGPQQLNTDTQEYMHHGAAGAQFVYLRGQTDCHTALDNIERPGLYTYEWFENLLGAKTLSASRTPTV